MANSPLVSIVILNWNGLDDTLVCLENVRKLDYQNFEVILVDNGSSAKQKRILSKINDVIYVDLPQNTGFTGGHIEGLKHAKGEFILLLNNDAVIHPSYIKNAIPIFNNPTVAVVGGRAYFWDDTNPILDASNEFYSYLEVNPLNGETAMNMSDRGMKQKVNTVSGSAVIVRRKIIDKVGYLEPSFFAYYEETDLFARIKRAGYDVIYSPDLHIWHRNGASSGAKDGSYFFFYHIFRNRFMFAIRNFEYSYFKRFISSYLRLGFRYIRKSHEGEVQHTLARSYRNAMLYNLSHLPTLLLQRRSIFKLNPKYNYCRTVVSEQIHFTYIFGCKLLTNKSLDAAIKSSTNLQATDELVILYEEISDDINIHSLPKNIRLVKSNQNMELAVVHEAKTANGSHIIFSKGHSLDLNEYRYMLSSSKALKRLVYFDNTDDNIVFIAKTSYFAEMTTGVGTTYTMTFLMNYIAKYASLSGELIKSAGFHSNENDGQQLAVQTYKLNSKKSSRNIVSRLKQTRITRLVTAAAKWLTSKEVSRETKRRRIGNILYLGVHLKFRGCVNELKVMYKESGVK